MVFIPFYKTRYFEGKSEQNLIFEFISEKFKSIYLIQPTKIGMHMNENFVIAFFNILSTVSRLSVHAKLMLFAYANHSSRKINSFRSN